MGKIKDFLRKRNQERNDVTKAMQEPPQNPERKLELLPIRMEPSIKEYEKLGFRFYKWVYKGARGKCDEVATDQVLCLAEMPEGWSIKRCTGLHSEIFDENETLRVSVFFKNEPWDRRGNMCMENF